MDENEEVCAALNISAMPTFQYYKNGTMVAEFKGADANQLKNLIEKHQ